jgi:hypothetical protein
MQYIRTTLMAKVTNINTMLQAITNAIDSNADNSTTTTNADSLLV